MRPTSSDHAAAARLAEEVRAKTRSQLRTSRKLTTLLDDFGAYALTSDVRGRVAQALDEAGLEVDPPLEQAERQERVQLSLRAEGSQLAELRDYSLWDPLEAIRVSRWLRGGEPEVVPLFDADAGSGVLWFDLSVLHTEPGAVFSALSPLCPGLTEEAVRRLFAADSREERPRGLGASTAMVVATGVDTQERSTDQGPQASKAGTVLLQPVAILAGDGWLVTAFQERKALRGGKEVGAEEPSGHEQLAALAETAWLEDELSSAGDLALTLLRGTIATNPATIRALESWLESWELEFYRRMEETERATLVDLRGILAELRRRVSGLRRIGRDPVREWFGGVSDPEVAYAADELIERSLRELRELNDTLRTSLDVVAASDSARTLRLAQAESRQSDRLQQQLALIASVLLVPTLVATVYGASTPGLLDYGGHLVMFAIMVAAGVLSYLYFRVFVYGRPPPGD